MTKHFMPATDTKLPINLEDWKAYHAVLEDLEAVVGAEEYGSARRLQVTWRLDDGTSVRDWLSFKLGKQSGGAPSKIRTLVNAIAHKPKGGPVEWVDDESLEFKIPDDKTAYAISLGAEVDLRGQTISTFSPTGDEIGRYRVTEYTSSIPF